MANAATAHDTDSVFQAAVKVRMTLALAVVRQPCVDCGSRVDFLKESQASSSQIE